MPKFRCHGTDAKALKTDSGHMSNGRVTGAGSRKRDRCRDRSRPLCGDRVFGSCVQRSGAGGAINGRDYGRSISLVERWARERVNVIVAVTVPVRYAVIRYLSPASNGRGRVERLMVGCRVIPLVDQVIGCGDSVHVIVAVTVSRPFRLTHILLARASSFVIICTIRISLFRASRHSSIGASPRDRATSTIAAHSIAEPRAIE
jgi:hypothetical protein